ncbi:MAG: 30S ribosomal protein S5 [Candidatus Caenarcaniphilales bacterium]|nr:30S ribosomal protein S5 [Candidatus Caenarcaniphilales bacterium]
MNSQKFSKGPGQHKKSNSKGDGNNQEGRNSRRSKDSFGGQQRNEKDNEWIEKVVQIRRVTKVVKGGKNLSFSALVVIGDMKGNVGVGLGKAAEVVDAIRKAIENAKKKLTRIPFDQGSIPHDITGHHGSTVVNLFRAPKGTGLIACWSIKMALESAGLHNVVCKTVGSTNPINVLGALQDAITKLKTKSQIRQLRGQVAIPA